MKNDATLDEPPSRGRGYEPGGTANAVLEGSGVTPGIQLPRPPMAAPVTAPSTGTNPRE